MKFSRAIQKRALNGMKSKASLGNEAPGFSTASGNDGTPCAQHDANASSTESHFPCTRGTLTAHHLAQLKTSLTHHLIKKTLRQKSEIQRFQLHIFEQYGVIPRKNKPNPVAKSSNWVMPIYAPCLSFGYFSCGSCVLKRSFQRCLETCDS